MTAALLSGTGDEASATLQAGGTSLACSKPANVADGDLLVAFVVVQGPFTASGQVIAGPTGWTLVSAPAPTNSTQRAEAILIKPVSSAAAETATSYTFTQSGPSGRMAVRINRVTGADLSSTLDAAGSYSSGGTTSVAVPGLTTTSANDLAIVLLHATGTSAQAWPTWSAPPSGWTQSGTIINTSATTGSASSESVFTATQVVAASGTVVGSMTQALTPAQTALSGVMVAIKSLAGASSYSGAANMSSSTSMASNISNMSTVVATAAMSSSTAAGASILTAVQAMLRNKPIYVAHRGGDADWIQNTPNAFAQSAAWNPNLALEVSVIPTSDGYFMLNDSPMSSPAFTANIDIRNQTKAWLKANLVSAADSSTPPMFLDDGIMPLYAGKRVIFIDNKTQTNESAFLDMLDANGGPGWWVVKYAGNAPSIGNAAIARGYQTWGYFFPSDTSAGAVNSTNLAAATLIGLEYDDTSAVWSQCVATGKPVIGHVIFKTSDATAAYNLGAVGLMAAGVKEVVPQVSTITGAMASSTALSGGAPNLTVVELGSMSSATSMTAGVTRGQSASAALASATTIAATPTQSEIAASALQSATTMSGSGSEVDVVSAAMSSSTTNSGAATTGKTGAASFASSTAIAGSYSEVDAVVIALTSATALASSALNNAVATAVLRSSTQTSGVSASLNVPEAAALSSATAMSGALTELLAAVATLRSATAVSFLPTETEVATAVMSAATSLNASSGNSTSQNAAVLASATAMATAVIATYQAAAALRSATATAGAGVRNTPANAALTSATALLSSLPADITSGAAAMHSATQTLAAAVNQLALAIALKSSTALGSNGLRSTSMIVALQSSTALSGQISVLQQSDTLFKIVNGVAVPQVLYHLSGGIWRQSAIRAL